VHAADSGSHTHTHTHTHGVRGGNRKWSSAPDQRQELVAGLGVLPEDPQHGAGDGLTVYLLHAAHQHAHVTEEAGEEVRKGRRSSNIQ